MIALRHIAVREGNVPPFVKVAATNLVLYGQSVKPDVEIEKIRGELGLGDVHTKDPEYRSVLREIRTIIQATKYDKLIGIDAEGKA